MNARTPILAVTLLGLWKQGHGFPKHLQGDTEKQAQAIKTLETAIEASK